MITETAEQQRARILAEDVQGEAWEYDLAIALGYEPESWTGMWSLVLHPFTFRDNKIIAEQVVSDDRGHALRTADGDRVITREIEHDIPEGWRVIEDRSLASSNVRYTFVPPLP
ncbi:hypothetical protein EDF22_0638 [Rathayibacter sp. PhB127]|uniref:hypothetical protein n=1 Tax=Rathayibacter sp. PhB127 TaxID=2485176 RepID=UPI000F4C4CA2|nr:hypothetical protein [Rathayibacter sp. PhB127]ROS28906.1 hypothetical protein EDF22_0638 [Rathayibacter sp. PhB127]